MAKSTEKYECMYILNPNLTEEETAAIVEKFKALVEANGTLDEMEEDLIYMDNLRAGLERLHSEDSRLADEYEEAISYVQSEGEKSREAEIEIEEER